MGHFGVIADDLTGAMDTGCPFAQVGVRTRVFVAPPWPERSDVDVVVLNTESRQDPPGQAYAKVRQGARSLGGRIVYKKIDSTLRGSIGQEVDAVMDELQLERALVAPAFPATGRVVLEGRLLVDGVPLRRTDFIEDPLCPSTEHIPTLLGGQSKRRVGGVGLDVVDQGPCALIREISGRVEEILVIDGSTQDHVLTISQAAASLGDTCLSCGSAGLAGGLPTGFGLRGEPGPSRWAGREDASVLVVAGSRRQATTCQIEKAISTSGICLVEVDPSQLEGTIERGAERVREMLADGRDVIVTSALAPYVPERSSTLAQGMAEIVIQAAKPHQLGGLVLTGGAIAFSVCRTLGIRALEIEGQVAPGVPVGRVVEGDWQGMRLVTKAGGFGEEETLVRAIKYLRGGNG